LLKRDGELSEVASVVGPEALEDKDRLLLAAAAILREFVLGQSAFDPNDAFSPPSKTFALADAAIRAFDAGTETLRRGVTFVELPVDAVRRALASLRDASVGDRDLARQRVEEAIGAMVSAAARESDGQP
jgi:V/A-type H+-transporting ATPase subunit A